MHMSQIQNFNLFLMLALLYIIIYYNNITVVDPDPLDKGEGGSLQKNLFRLFGPQFVLEIRGGGGVGPQAPPLDPTLY